MVVLLVTLLEEVTLLEGGAVERGGVGGAVVVDEGRNLLLFCGKGLVVEASCNTKERKCCTLPYVKIYNRRTVKDVQRNLYIKKYLEVT